MSASIYRPGGGATVMSAGRGAGGEQELRLAVEAISSGEQVGARADTAAVATPRRS